MRRVDNALIVKEMEHGSPEYEKAVALRFRILREPLGLTFTPEQLAAECQDIHLAAFEGEAVIGNLILTRVSDEKVHMRQVAVDSDRQGQGVGRALVTASEAVARREGYRIITLHARETARPFYERLGYVAEGPIFEEVTLPHRHMEKDLDADPQQTQDSRAE